MKIAAAGFQHETNRFSPIPTTHEDFVREDGWPGLTEGDAVFEVFRDANIPIGGFLSFARRKGIQAVPILWASAEPAGLIKDDAFDRLSAQILEGIAATLPVDGIYLDLHGAMVTESFEDGEGEFLRRLRDRFGDEIPVAVSLDLHANVTLEMVKFSNVITIYRTYPHLDMAETGYRAGELLHEIVESGKKPHASFKKPPLLLPLHTQCTTMEPCQSLYALLPEENSLKTGTADIALGFPPSDIAQNGPGIVSYDFIKKRVKQTAQTLHDALMSLESMFDMPLFHSRDAVRSAMERSGSGKPIILADIQDVAGAGSTTETTELLNELALAKAKNVGVAAFYDKDAVMTAHTVGIGGEFDCELGGKISGPDHPGFEGRFRVAALSDGKFDFTGEMMGGIKANIGPTAAIDLISHDAEIRIVVTGERIQPTDQSIFTHLGINPADFDLLVLKSVVHFRADFEPIADEIILVVAPGFSPCVLTEEIFPRLRRGVKLL